MVDNLFADLKGKYVFISLDGLVYSVAISKHQLHIRELLGRLHSADFTLDKQVVMGASEIKYLGHYLTFRVTGYRRGYKEVPSPRNFGSARRFLERVRFYVRFITVFNASRPNA